MQNKKKKKLIEKIAKLNIEANKMLSDLFTNYKVLKFYSVENQLIKKFSRIQKSLMKTVNQQNGISGFIYGLEEFINFIFVAC